MGFFSWAKSKVTRKKKSTQLGKIYVKPSEEKAAEKIAAKAGGEVQVVTPSRGGEGGGGGGTTPTAVTPITPSTPTTTPPPKVSEPLLTKGETETKQEFEQRLTERGSRISARNIERGIVAGRISEEALERGKESQKTRLKALGWEEGKSDISGKSLSMEEFAPFTFVDIGKSEGLKREYKKESLSDINKGMLEAFSTTEVPSRGTGMSGTMVTIPTPESQLSEEALITKKIVGESVAERVRLDISMEKKEAEIMKRISPGGVTVAEASAANIEMKKFYEDIIGTSKTKMKTKFEDVQKEVKKTRHPYETRVSGWIPKIDFGTEKLPEQILASQQKLPKWMRATEFEMKAGVIGGAIIPGMYEGFRLHPIKTTAALGIGAGMAVATAGLSTAAVSGGYIGAKTLSTAGTIAGRTLLAGYAGTAGARVYLTPGLSAKGLKIGELISTEMAPFFIGGKVGGYGVRRYSAWSEMQSVIKKQPISEQLKIKAELKEVKAYYKAQPPVKELSFKGMERLSKASEKDILGYLQSKKGSLIVGGTGGVRSQLLVKEIKAPHDIDIFTLKGQPRQYAKELTKIMGSPYKLKGAKIKVGGETAIEFHGFEDFLRFNIEQVAPLTRTWRSGITKTPSGIKVLRMAPQAQMKLLGFYRYGKARTKDIIFYKTQAKPTLVKAAQLQTVGKKGIYEVPFIKGAAPGHTILGEATFKGFKPQSIKILKGLKQPFKSKVISHELVHAMHPLWSEKRVLVTTGTSFGVPRGSGLRIRRLQVKTGEPTPKKVKLISKIKTYPSILETPTLYPIIPKTTGYSLFKPSKPYTPQKTITPKYQPYPPTKQPLYSPFKPPKQPPYQPYEPSTIIPPVVTTTPYKRTTERKAPIIWGHVSLGLKQPFKPMKPQRPFHYQESLVALAMRGTKLQQQYTTKKVPKGFEMKTGLVMRPLLAPKKKKKKGRKK